MTGIMSRIGRTREDGERGAVLVTVIGIGAVLMLIVTALLAMASSGTIKSNSDQDYQNAGAAAYAGLADYQARISADNSYEQYGNINSTFSTGSTFTTVAGDSTHGNKAFSTKKTEGWVGVSGSDGTKADNSRDGKYREWFRYEVNNANYYGQGVVTLRVTGKAGKVTRSLVANIKGTGFINYLYFTDYESGDPSLSNSTCTPLHWNEKAASGQTACAAIQFAAGDTLAGPVRTNDKFTICGAKFLNDVQSTAPDGSYNNPGCAAGQFAKNSVTGLAQVQHVSSIGLPPTNTNMRQETRTDLTASTVPQPGCLYTGPTTINFTSAGKMTVYSPWTKFTNITGSTTDPGTQLSAQCGTPGYSSSGGTLGSPGGQTLDVPKNNLVYVQNVPTTTDPNKWAGTSKTSPSNYTCTGADGVTAGNGVGYPAKNEYTGGILIDDPYNCQRGDAFVQGTFKGALTVVAQNYVYATGDIKYVDSGASASPNLLGLVGQRAVIVYNPMTTAYCSGSGTSKTCAPMSYVRSNGSLASANAAGYVVNREIDAAIASNTGTFTVENYDQGKYNGTMYGQGTLTILGSIAQKFRGPVATTTGSGFDKAYGYDKRLLSTAPPKFLQPVATTYGPTTQVEVKAAFSADGTPTS